MKKISLEKFKKNLKNVKEDKIESKYSRGFAVLNFLYGIEPISDKMLDSISFEDINSISEIINECTPDDEMDNLQEHINLNKLKASLMTASSDVVADTVDLF